MMNSNTVILRTAAMYLMPLQLLFSIFLLLRGHDEPGGGFIGGLVAAGAFVLYAFSYGSDALRSLIRLDPRDLLGAGLLFGLASAIPSLWVGEPLLTAQWWTVALPGDAELKLSSPLIFDIGVYLAVVGTILTFVIQLMEAEHD